MNRNNRGANTNSNLMIADVIGFVFAYWLTLALTHCYYTINIWTFTATIIVFTIVYMLCNKEGRIYNVTFFFYMDRFLKIIIHSWMSATIVTALIMFAFNASDNMRRTYFTFLVISLVVVLVNMPISRFFQKVGSNTRAPRVVYVGVFEDYRKFNYYLNKTSIKLEQIGYVVEDEEDLSKHNGIINVLGRLSRLEEIIRENNIDQVYFMQKPEDKYNDISAYVDLCMEMGVTAKVIVASKINIRAHSFVSSVGEYPVITYHTISLNTFDAIVKRFMDIVISLLVLILFSPILIIIAAAIKLDSRGNVFHKSVRVGQNGRNFNQIKFRIMYEDREEGQLTRVGRIIEKLRIDELPQLFNVLAGSMSLVGTRPPMIEEVEKYSRAHWKRISIKPGVTGLWSISKRTKNANLDKLVELDTKYIEEWSILLDIKILFLTALTIFK